MDNEDPAITQGHRETALSSLNANTGMDLDGPGLDGRYRTWCKSCSQLWPCEVEKMRRALAEAEALLHPIEWWICVWCETKYPYDDGPDTLKAHSAVCAKHPANIALDAERALADRLAEALTYAAHQFVADDQELFTDADYVCSECKLVWAFGHHLSHCGTGAALVAYREARQQVTSK